MITSSLVYTKSVTPLPEIPVFYQYAKDMLRQLSKKHKNYVKNIQVDVENFADQETLDDLKIKDKYDLLGLYRGIPIPIKLLTTNSSDPDIIFLYRCPLIRYCITNGEDLRDLVNKVMIHEIAHHFGFSEEDLSNL